MAGLNFPPNPNVGDNYTLGNRTWQWNGSAWQLQSNIISTNPFTVVSAVITSSTNSTSTTTGALTVAGGIGVGRDIYSGGSIYAQNIYENGNLVLTGISPTAGTGITISNVTTSNGNVSFTINSTVVNSITGTTYIGVSASSGSVIITNLGVQTLTAGTDTAVSAATGTVTVWSTATLQSVTDRGSSTTNIIYINNTSDATTVSSGALQVAGGVSIGGQLYVGGALFAGGAEVLTTSTFNPTYNEGPDISITKNTATNIVTFSNTSTLQTVTGRGSTTTHVISMTNNTDSTSTNSGALTVAGGVGVGGNVNIGGNITVANINASTSLTIGNSEYSYFTSPSVGTESTVNLDFFNIDQYRTVKYLVQVVDYGYTPNLIHSAELLLAHDHNGSSTQGYIVQYGIVTNYGELGTWDAVYTGGLITLNFTPNYVPTNMVIKVNRIVLTT